MSDVALAIKADNVSAFDGDIQRDEVVEMLRYAGYDIREDAVEAFIEAAMERAWDEPISWALVDEMISERDLSRLLEW